MAKEKTKMSDRLRTAVERSGVSRYQIAQETGITESSLSRFVAGGLGLSVDALDILFEYLDLGVVERAKKHR
jgi:transcriptional regulator with XRE-family HTH domain